MDYSINGRLIKECPTEILSDLQQAIYREKSKRRNAEYKKINKCPECYGTGFVVGSLSCVRCDGTGKYVSKKLACRPDGGRDGSGMMM